MTVNRTPLAANDLAAARAMIREATRRIDQAADIYANLDQAPDFAVGDAIYQARQHLAFALVEMAD